ncbi:hypothetical protein [Dyella humicola]|uniref:hypothetical protein n=1 Tax=Dyella humicola TaxID=2992126 RepID=UPI0022521DDD|nr:hypothetical protein [Dyella humicola]
MEKLKVAAIATICALLAGCGSSAVSAVKDMKFDLDPTFTVGQILDNRSVCESKSWKATKDDRGRTVVEYRCDLKNASEPLKSVAKQYIVEEEQTLAAWKATLQGNIEKTKALAQAHEELLAKIQAATSDAELAPLLQMERDDVSSPEVFHGRIEKEKERQIGNLQSSIAAGKADIERNEGSSGGTVDQLAKETDQKLQLAKTLEGTSRVEEVYQWVIDPDGNPLHSVAGFDFIGDAGKSIYSLNFRSGAFLMNIANTKVQTFAEYVGDQGVIRIIGGQF